MRIIENICLLPPSFFDRMRVFEILKSRKDTVVIEILNCFLSYDTRLALANIKPDFLNSCAHNNVYPVSFWKSLRRSRIRLYSSSLGRRAKSVIHTMQSTVDLLRTAVAIQTRVLDQRFVEERIIFVDFMRSITQNEAIRMQVELDRTLEEKKTRHTFPVEPERYFHTLSDIPLDKT